ncbi:hypothetical protein AGMMS49944_11280 [Spirochaetia bacterium]|nr:hypothetical protein AGMMS49944_11280 [Spirochaetia bacterium]
MKKVFVLMVLLAVFAGSLTAQTDSDFEIDQLSDGTVLVSRYKGNDRFVRVPAKLYDTPVSKIGWRAFYGIDEVQAVILSRGIKQIGLDDVPMSYTYSKGSVLYIELPTGLTKIGPFAMTDQTLVTLTIPDTVTSIGESAFQDNQLREIIIPKNVKTIGVSAFKGNALKRVVLESVFSITSRWGRGTVFAENTNIESITMPANWPNEGLGQLGFDSNFVNFYISQNKAAGTYYKNGPVWKYSARPIAPEKLDSAQKYIERGDVAYEAWDLMSALSDYNEALRLEPNNITALDNCVLTYLQMRNYEKAIAELGKNITLDPNNAKYYIGRASCYEIMKNFDKALADYNKMIELEPENASRYNSRGIFYYSTMKNYAKALEDFTTASRLAPSSETYKKNVGLAQSKIGG